MEFAAHQTKPACAGFRLLRGILGIVIWLRLCYNAICRLRFVLELAQALRVGGFLHIECQPN